MTTASVLVTVTTSWNVTGEKIDKEGCLAKTMKSYVSEAAQEIRETTAIREQALRIMRDWIQQNNDVKNVRQDDAFLLRFLRQKKYSIPMAQQTLLKYLSLRNYYPGVFKNLDCEDAKLQDILNNGHLTIMAMNLYNGPSKAKSSKRLGEIGVVCLSAGNLRTVDKIFIKFDSWEYVAVSPIRDAKGRRVIVYNMSKFDASKYGCWDMCRAHVLVYESLMGDPLNQMCGYTHVGDGNGVTSAHVTTWNPTDFARLLKWGEQSVPMRHKEIHLVNVPVAIKYIVDFATSKVSPKMAERLHIHCNLKTLTKKVDVECLPKEFGGKIQFSEMIAYTKKILNDRRQELLDLDNMELLSTRGITSSRRPNGLKPGEGSVEGSFRKLEID